MHRKTIKVTAGAIAASASVTNAGIVVFDISPDLYSQAFANGPDLKVGTLNFTNSTFDTNTSSTFRLWAQYNGAAIIGGAASVAQGSEGGVFGGFYVQLLAAGATVGSSLSFGVNGYASIFDAITPEGTHYIGLRQQDGAQTMYGWLEFITSNGSAYPGSGMYSHLQFTRFAFETSGQSILAGDVGTPVPEASTFGLVGGLFGLVAAAHLRRRKAKQAAASDKFLALAAGEKLN